MMIILALVPIFFLAGCVPAFAADATTMVSVTDLLTGLVALGGGVALAIARPVAAAVVSWFETQTRIKLDDSQRALLDDLCYRGIEYATSRIDQRIAADQPAIDVRSVTLASAADYVLAHAPDAAAHFGLDREGVVRMVTARFGVVSTGAAPAAAPAA